MLYLKRHGSARDWSGFFVFSILALPVVLIRESVRGNAGSVLAKASGILDGFLGRRRTVE